MFPGQTTASIRHCLRKGLGFEFRHRANLTFFDAWKPFHESPDRGPAGQGFIERVKGNPRTGEEPGTVGFPRGSSEVPLVRLASGLLEQLRMSSGTGEVHCASRTKCIVQTVDEQEVSANVTLAVLRQLSSQRVVPTLRTERVIVGDELQHDFFQTLHIVAAGARQPSPVLEELTAEIRATRDNQYAARGPTLFPG